MSTTIEVGDRFESKDTRDPGRIIEIIEARGLSRYGDDTVRREARRYQGVETTESGMRVADYLDLLRSGETFFVARTEVNPNNPKAVGHHSRVSEKSLLERYRKVSR